MNLNFDLQQIASAFIVLFAMIDVTGLTPIIIDIQAKSGPIKAGKAAFYSLIAMVAFLFLGDLILGLFNVDIKSFAAAGALVIFIMALEMILGIEIFKYNDSPAGSTTIVPIVFPLIAGAGTFTALITLRAQYAVENIIIGLVLNIILVYFVLKNIHLLEKFLGKGGIYVLRKFFGIILLAVAVDVFTNNIASLLAPLIK